MAVTPSASGFIQKLVSGHVEDFKPIRLIFLFQYSFLQLPRPNYSNILSQWRLLVRRLDVDKRSLGPPGYFSIEGAVRQSPVPGPFAPGRPVRVTVCVFDCALSLPPNHRVSRRFRSSRRISDAPQTLLMNEDTLLSDWVLAHRQRLQPRTLVQIARDMMSPFQPYPPL